MNIRDIEEIKSTECSKCFGMGKGRLDRLAGCLAFRLGHQNRAGIVMQMAEEVWENERLLYCEHALFMTHVGNSRKRCLIGS